jgi:hypothetical protein
MPDATVVPADQTTWPGTTYSLTYEQSEQRVATALKVLAPLGFVDGNEEGESPGFVMLHIENLPGIYRPSFAFNVSGYATLADALASLMPKLAEHFREQGREEIRQGFRNLMQCAVQPAKPSQAYLHQQAEQQEREERYLEDRMRRIAREEARRD